MNQHDPATVERVIQEVTREVLLRLNLAQTIPAGGGTTSGCNCTDGSCAQHCADKVHQVVQAGASRVTATLGTRPVSQEIKIRSPK